MKKLLFSLSLLATLATFAGESTVETTAQVFGVLPITSSATNVIVSVPWVAASSTDTNKISVAEIIKTANLTEGDWIRVWNAGTTNNKFKVWNLEKNSQNVLEWQAATVVDAKGAAKTGTSEDTYLERGDAIILHRQNPGTGSGNTFYVYGQYKALDSDSTTCAVGTVAEPAYTLIAPPNVTEIDVNTGITWANVTETSTTAGDQLMLNNGNMPTWDGSTWGSKSYNKTQKKWIRSDETTKVGAGVGFWFISRGGKQVTATWKN